jgi:hypothetical protein
VPRAGGADLVLRPGAAGRCPNRASVRCRVRSVLEGRPFRGEWAMCYERRWARLDSSKRTSSWPTRSPERQGLPGPIDAGDEDAPERLVVARRASSGPEMEGVCSDCCHVRHHPEANRDVSGPSGTITAVSDLPRGFTSDDCSRPPGARGIVGTMGTEVVL